MRYLSEQQNKNHNQNQNQNRNNNQDENPSHNKNQNQDNNQTQDQHHSHNKNPSHNQDENPKQNKNQNHNHNQTHSRNQAQNNSHCLNEKNKNQNQTNNQTQDESRNRNKNQTQNDNHNQNKSQRHNHDRSENQHQTQNNNPNQHNKIYWHESFLAALELELYEYADILQFESERQLSKEALLMDVLIIKKQKNVQIKKSIGVIFKAHNIFEYKSETDYLSVWDYNKVMGYAMLYSAFENIPEDEITISFAITKHPRKLFEHLQNKRGIKISEAYPGVYYIQGEIIPIQILERRRLSPDDNLFLRNLGSNLETKDMFETFNAFRVRGVSLDKVHVYLNRLIEANPRAFKEVVAMNATVERIIIEAFEEIGMEKVLERTGFVDRAMSRQKAQFQKIRNQDKLQFEEIRNRDKLRLAKKMLLKGQTPEEVAELIELPLDAVKRLQDNTDTGVM